MIIPAGEFWLPISVGYAMGEPIVTVARLKQMPVGFLSDIDLRRNGDIVKIPLNDIEIEQNMHNMAGLVFHLPRSGSTAVARALTSIDCTSCFFEPAALDQLLSPQLMDKIDPIASLKKLLLLFESVSHTSKHKVFIKLSSWSTLHIFKYRNALPTTPFFFVYRNPIEILVQILQRPTGWMQSPAKKEIEKMLGLERSMAIEEFSGTMLSIFCDEVLKLQPKPIPIKHSTLMESSVNAIEQVLDYDLRDIELQQLRSSFKLDSEDWQKPSDYIADSLQLINSAPESLVEMCQRIVKPSIARIDAELRN